MTDQQQRAAGPAVRHGFGGRCPACGNARLFRAFLKPVDRCGACGQDWTGQRADDFPAYLVILILGHVLVPIVVSVNRTIDVPMGVQAIGWPLLTLILALLMIQPMKGAVIGWQWARRMHGL